MSTEAVQYAFARADALHQAGRLSEAEVIYRQILSQHPRHADAIHRLGVLAHQSGQNQIAIELIGRAIAINPTVAAYHNNFSVALKAQGRLSEAIEASRAAIRLAPQLGSAHYNLGSALLDQRLFDPAIQAFRESLRLEPDVPECHNELGIALSQSGRSDEAADAFFAALRCNPDFADAWNNLGNVYKARGRLDQAVEAYQTAVRFAPDLADAHYNLGTALQDQRQLDKAIASYQTALHLKPDLAGCHVNLGNAYLSQADVDAALACFRRAMALGHPQAHSNLVYGTHFHPAFDASAIYQEHLQWSRQFAEPLEPLIQPHANDRNPDRRLRVGYISPDFRDHVIGRFLLPLFEHHDHQQFEIFGYSDVSRADSMTERLRARTDTWRETAGLSDEQLARQIRQDQIDLLIDLTMHMEGNRLLVFARKPAPAQATYLAYAGTTGLKTIDYRITDPYLDPPGSSDDIYSEESVRLPETYWCYAPDAGAPEVIALPAKCAGHITFGCLNNFAKVSHPALLTWCALLKRLPDSRLILHSHPGSHRQRLHDLLRDNGIEPDRLSFVGFVPPPGYFELYHQIDIALDPFPYNGGTTTCDALWMGVPVVSLAGKTAVGRGSASILSNLGLPELVARSEDEYIRIATDLASDLPRLSDLRRTLRARMQTSVLMDAPRFARNMEAAYRRMWRGWCNDGGASLTRIE